MACRTRRFRSIHDLVEDLLLALEVEVEGAQAAAGVLGDLHDRGAGKPSSAKIFSAASRSAGRAARGERCPRGHGVGTSPRVQAGPRLMAGRHVAGGRAPGRPCPGPVRGSSGHETSVGACLNPPAGRRSAHAGAVSSAATRRAAPRRRGPSRPSGRRERPTTAASATAGCRRERPASTSAGATFSPPEMKMSLSRSTTR